MTERINWLNYFMQIAQTASKRSTCIRAQVGAVIVKNNEIKSTGYNGMPSGVEHCLQKGECSRITNNIPSGTRYETCRSIHAEQNAIIQAGKANTQNAAIYVFGHDQVCILCKRFIIQAGIKTVYLSKNEEFGILVINPEDWKGEL